MYGKYGSIMDFRAVYCKAACEMAKSNCRPQRPFPPTLGPAFFPNFTHHDIIRGSSTIIIIIITIIAIDFDCWWFQFGFGFDVFFPFVCFLLHLPVIILAFMAGANC